MTVTEDPKQTPEFLTPAPAGGSFASTCVRLRLVASCVVVISLFVGLSRNRHFFTSQ